MTTPEWPIIHHCISGKCQDRWPLKIWVWSGDEWRRNSFHIQFRWRGITHWHMWFI